MGLSVVMPALEMAQETGKLVSWLKQEGDHVRKGEMLLEVETDKAVVEIEATGDGILGGVTAKPGDVIQVGHTIAWLLQPGEAPPAVAATPVSGRTSSVPAAQPASTSVAGPGVAAAGAGPRLSPKARRLAQEHGVDVASLKGSGPGGEILADDILAAATKVRLKPDATTSDSVVGTAQVRPKADTTGDRPGADVVSGFDRTSTASRLMAERTTQSWTTVPHFFLSREVDATALNTAREQQLATIERTTGVRVTHSDLLVAAVARVLKRHPRMNASWSADGITQHPHVNVALAIAVENAVVTAVIADADKASVGEIAARRRDLSDRARAGRLQPSDIAGATFTISNLGMFEVDAFTAIIVPPQAGILAVGAIADRVVAIDGKPSVRPTMTLTLSSDHRVVDGATAAAFLKDVVTELSST
jgi:pyruvate dehydrogenase E2 component (dihydrolipoamide acetyltransferase)